MSKVRIKKWMWVTLAVFVALQIYFVRELLAAEILFGLLFALGLLIALLIFVIEEVSGRGMEWVRPHAREFGGATMRRLSQLEEFSRKSYRHLRSESAR